MNNLNNNKVGKISKRGFTLLELLIVIGILAILTTIVTLVLNPAELLRQARDGQRLSDLRAVNNALGLFIVASSTLPSTVVGLSNGYCTFGTALYSPDTGTCTTNSTTKTDGTGWVNVNFSSMAGGSPLSRLPLDPINGAANYYIYRSSSDGTQFELNANMESVKYSTGGGSDVESNTKDGGSNNNVYEIGTNLTLI